jgi:hypothetical protein
MVSRTGLAHPQFARVAHTELLVIDKTTTSRVFSLGVGWNRADIRSAHAL